MNFFFIGRGNYYKYEIETFLFRSSSIIEIPVVPIVTFMSKFCNIIFSTFNDTFYPIVHKSFSSPCTSSPRAKLNFSKSDFQNARIFKVFSPDVKIRYHGVYIYIIYRKRDIEYSSRSEKSNTGTLRGKILIGQHSPRILSMRQHAEMCSLPG